jgi:hypothetical protein
MTFVTWWESHSLRGREVTDRRRGAGVSLFLSSAAHSDRKTSCWAAPLNFYHFPTALQWGLSPQHPGLWWTIQISTIARVEPMDWSSVLIRGIDQKAVQHVRTSKKGENQEETHQNPTLWSWSQTPVSRTVRSEGFWFSHPSLGFSMIVIQSQLRQLMAKTSICIKQRALGKWQENDKEQMEEGSKHQSQIANVQMEGSLN